MQHLAPDTAFMLGVLAGWAALALLAGLLWLVRPWLLAWASGSRISAARLLGMRLRGTPIMVLIPAYVTLRKRGVDIDLDALEAAYMAEHAAIRSSEDLVRVAERTLLKRQDV